MQREEMEFILALAGIIGGFATAWALGYGVFRWVQTRAQRAITADAARVLQQQIAQLQLSVDSMSIEVERIAEAQRYTTRLLAGPESDPMQRTPR
jgi:hypothetical protein